MAPKRMNSYAFDDESFTHTGIATRSFVHDLGAQVCRCTKGKQCLCKYVRSVCKCETERVLWVGF